MPTPLLESASTFAFFSLLSQGPPPLKTFALLRALFTQSSKMTALLQIQGHCGRSLLIIFVMTLLANLLGCALEKTPLLKRLGIIAFISLSSFSLLLERPLRISRACHR